MAIMALLGGAAGIGFAPIFVRWSEVGPSATAFYRIFFALPILAFVSRLEPGAEPAKVVHSSSSGWICVLAGVLFAADLAFWHWSIRLTSVANSTLLTNCAPFFVMLGARALFGERITAFLVGGMVVASLGAGLLVGVNLGWSAGHARGDLLALVTAGFYGGYLLSIKHLRRSLATGHILFWSGSVSCLLLLIIAVISGETVRPVSARGWLVLLGLAAVSHVGGQGLIGYALAHLPAGFSSVSLLTQPVVAAALAWVLLSEPLSWAQVLGGGIVLVGIALASFSPSQARSSPTKA
jgi:drug/metabolite transporter (DMT)-like permease